MTSDHPDRTTIQPETWTIPPAAMPADRAVMLGRHVKAALMHLGRAEDLLAGAGVDLDAVLLNEPSYPLANLVRAALDAVEDLDGWAVGNVAAVGAIRAAYAGTEHWCHRPGGVLPVSPPAGDHNRPAKN